MPATRPGTLFLGETEEMQMLRDAVALTVNNNNNSTKPTRRKKKRRAADEGVKKFEGRAAIYYL